MYEENFPSNTDELPICPSRASWALSANRIDWVCPYEVDTRLFDFAEAVFQPFLPKLDDTENQALFNVINSSQRGQWTYEYDNLSSTLYRSQSLPATMSHLAWILSGFGILSVIALLFNLACNKMGYLPKSQKTESRGRLFLRIGVYITLFIAILLGAIGYGGVVTDLNTRWILNSNLERMDKELQLYKDEVIINQTYAATRSFIQREFDTVGEEMVERCQAASTRNGFGIKNLRQNVYTTWTRASDFLGDLRSFGDSVKNSEGVAAALKDVFDDSILYHTHISNGVKRWEVRGMGVVSQADKDRIFNSRSESLEESFRLLEQIEKDHIRDREKNRMLQNWLTNVFSFVSNAHKSLLFVHFDYNSYQTPVVIIITFGLIFLLLGYFATFYKFLHPTGKPEVRRMEKWLGRLVYVGYFYFVLTTCYLSWNFMSMIKPTIAATSTCGAIADMDTFFPGRGPASNQFYRLKEFEDIEQLLVNPKWQRGGRNAPLLGRMSFLDHLGQIIQQSDYFEPPMVFDNFTETIRHWKNDVETMTRSCYQMDAPVDQKYADKLQLSVNKLAHLGVTDLADSLRGDKLDELMAIYNFTQEIARIQWDHPSYEAFRPTPTVEESLIDNLSYRIGNETIAAWKEISSMYNLRHPRRLFLISEGIICGQWARPSVTLLVTAIINTFLWVLCTVTMLSTARRWDLGEEEAAATSLLSAQDGLGAPLIDKSKLEEALYDNHVDYI